MPTILRTLDAAAERFGGAAIGDPVALAGALRTATDPPTELEIAVLTHQLDGSREAIEAVSRPGSTRSLRWKYVVGQPGVKTGIAAGSSEAGEGTRVDALRAYWADPSR